MILPFHKIGRSDASKAGGKGASLGEMTQAGIPVPPGFVVLAEAFEAFIDANNVRSEIHDILEHLDHNSVTSIESSSAQIQELILAGDIPEDIQQEIQTYQKDITTDYVAVRSSATAEDGIEHAWAGQLDTYLNVPKNAIEKKIQSCWASLFTPRALFYRSEKGLVDIHISVAVIVQSMVDAESAGVAFSVHPVTENTDEIVIEGSWGLGEAVVSGEVTPDSFVISKSSREILSQHIAEKKKGIFRNKNGQNEWREIPEQERENPVLNEKALNGLSELVIHIEDHYGFPCDIEWVYAGGKIYILQARPITTLKKNEDIKKNIFEENWQIGATRNMPLWHDILCLYAWEDNMRDYGVDEKCKCLFAIENATHATMFMQTENQKKYFEATAKRCKDGKAVKKLRKKYEIYAHDVQKSLEKLMQQNSVENLKIFLKHYQRFTAGLWITTGFGRIGTENLEKALIKAGIQQEKIPEYISTLTYPEEHTPLFASQKDMLILGEKIQSGKKINRKKEILGWLENHKFIPVNFCEDPWTEEDAEKQLTDILEQDCKVALQKLNKSHRDKLKEKRRLQEELDQDISDISDALAEATSLNEYRKNIFCRLSYSIRFVFEKMIKKVGSSNRRDAYYCTPDEMVEICRGKKINIQKIKEERQKCVLVREGDSIVWGSEGIVQNYFEKIYNKNEESGKILTGFSANKGKITGRVKVVLSTRDFHKVNRGDILVATMTSVDFVPIMEKAGAFVTNEGGITSHAAIVAREMNKPCIIGTKNATRVLQDDDLVEVDADTGTIKILNKENEIQWGFTYDRQMSYQRIELFHHGYCARLSDFFDVTLENELYRIQNSVVSVFYDETSHKQAFKKIRAHLGGKEKIQWYKKIYNTVTEDYTNFIHFLDQGEKKKDLKNLEKSLSENMQHNKKISLSTWLLYSYVEEILSDEIKIMLAKKGIKNQQEVFEILSQPDEMIPSDTWEYDIAGAALAKNKKQEKIIKKLCLKYRSYGMYDVMFDGKSEKDIQEKITSISKIEAQKIIKNLDQKYSKQKSELKKVEKVKWSETESSLIQLYRLYANFKDWKNFHRERSSYQIRDIYQAIAKKYKQKQEYLSYMTEAEILKGIKQKKWHSDEEIEKRKKNSAIIFLDKITKNILEIKKLQELDKKLFIEKNSLSGTTAFPGNITGTARIINSHDDLKKLEKGDIMVSSTTRPDYLPFMSDIEGFVTNEGGVLSHAAILAREIKKPCIIGTKIATQVIKSGDKITMDGKNGIITIHQKKKNYLENKKLLSEGGRACYLYPNRIFCTRMNMSHPLWENHLMVISTSENHKVNWYFAVDDESEFDYTLRRVLEHKNMLEKGEKEINRLVRKAQKTLKKQYKTAKEAWSGYENFISIYEEIAIVPTFVRQLDRAVVRSLRESIHGEEDFAIAVYPAKRTYQRQEEIALLELRTQFDDTITTDIQKKLDKIYAQYFTSGLGYFEEQIKTKSDYREKLLGNSRKEAKDHFKKIMEEEREILQKKQKLKKIFPQKAQIIDIAGFLVYLKDHYKFQINRVQHYAEGLFRSISAISGYDESLIRDMTPDEVKNLLLLKKIDEKNIQKRIAYHAYVYNDSGEPELIIGEEAKAFTQKYLATNNLQKSFSGRVACKGQGRGKAKVILGTRDFHKMEQGDILVVMNTSPDFVPIMKKATAIVAEEGGITGHVSVVSREFGIPSVVGIKQITSIIQDGEIIEVDALRGVVTRID